MTRRINSWVDLERDCPISLDRISQYSKDFERAVSVGVENLDKAKENLLEARGYFDLMITSLIQMLYSQEIVKRNEDRILFAWLKDDLGRFLKRLDDHERDLLIDFDSANKDKDMVGISRVSTYSKYLKTAYQSIIYETLLKSTQEYFSFEESEKIKREPRTFLYILFHILQVTMSILGGLTREKTGSLGKRGIINTYPSSWQYLMTDNGKRQIEEGFKEDTGIDISEISEFEDLNLNEKIGGDIEDELE